jgi:hypothetical protein
MIGSKADMLRTREEAEMVSRSSSSGRLPDPYAATIAAREMVSHWH